MLPETATAMPRILDRGRARASLATSRARPDVLAPAIAYAGVLFLAVAAPFEWTQPLVRLPSQSISNLEALLLVVFAAWLAAAAWSRRWPRVVTGLTWPWIALLSAMILSAVAAPASRMNSLHMAGRFVVAFAVYLLTVNGLTTPVRVQRALSAALAAGIVVSALAILEYLQIGLVLQWLEAFRPGTTVVGSQVRAGGPLQYPTIASMYLEVIFAFGLGLLLFAVDARRRTRAAAIFVALVLVAEAIVVTFTRAGLMAMAAGLIFVGAARYSRRGADSAVRLIVALSIVIAGAFFTSRSAQSVWLRLTSEGQEAWYRFTVAAPERLELASGSLGTVPVTVTNTGRLTWDSSADPPFYLSYHWLEAESDRVVTFNGSRTQFPTPVPPGATIAVDAVVKSLRRPGTYRLAWDVVQEGRLWFSTEPGAILPAFTRVSVNGPAIDAPPEIATTALPRPAVRPGRLVLWRAAARMLAAHPILGVGPDNFRLLYGEHAQLPGAADPRMHSNNMYIEVLAGVGLLGGVAFAWWLWRATQVFAGLLSIAGRHLSLALGIAGAGVAVALHGVVDSFLGFTPTYVLIALTLGLAVACARSGEREPDAHRV